EQELPSRYSWVPIVTGGSVFWSAAALLAVAAWVRRRRVQALRRAELAAEEAAEDAAAKLSISARFNGSGSDAHHLWSNGESDGAASPPSRSSDDDDLPSVAESSEDTPPPRRVLH
ncbi:MAG TPA: GlyGly-CTERM sorting domain-containing protein, partial [Myxococcaceae bacterium]|nr:GlyGly-CTERM sorting domain-containing protein [Myxococcaceae bacterium]